LIAIIKNGPTDSSSICAIKSAGRVSHHNTHTEERERASVHTPHPCAREGEEEESEKRLRRRGEHT